MNANLNVERFNELEKLAQTANAGPRSKSMLTNLQQQDAFIHAQHKKPMPCPNPDCKKPVSQYDAALDDITDTSRSVKDDRFACPHCLAGLKFILTWPVGQTYWELRSNAPTKEPVLPVIGDGAPDIDFSKKIVAYIPPGAFVEGQGFRVSFVVEGEDGHRPNGTWPYHGKPGESMPWFWGDDYAKAVEAAESYNAARGISKEEAAKIISDSIMRSMRSPRRA